MCARAVLCCVCSCAQWKRENAGAAAPADPPPADDALPPPADDAGPPGAASPAAGAGAGAAAAADVGDGSAAGAGVSVEGMPEGLSKMEQMRVRISRELCTACASSAHNHGQRHTLTMYARAFLCCVC